MRITSIAILVTICMVLAGCANLRHKAFLTSSAVIDSTHSGDLKTTDTTVDYKAPK
jgi:hypothetical protein